MNNKNDNYFENQIYKPFWTNCQNNLNTLFYSHFKPQKGLKQPPL